MTNTYHNDNMLSSNPTNYRWFALLGGMAVALELIPNVLGGYGYFIDELYYIACAKRLAWGYVDHPPLAPMLLRLDMVLFGDSLFSIRLLPALTGGATVCLTAWMTERLGGGRFAQVLAALAVLASPVDLIFFDIFTMNGFEILLWTGMLAVVVLMIQRNEPRFWIAFGLLSGIALENKHTVVLLGAAVVVGLIVTPQRELLWNRWLLLGGGIAFVLFLPNLWWQMQHGYPALEFYRNATLLKNRPLPPLQIVVNQLLFMNPVTALVWLTGLWFFFFDERGRPLRTIGWAYVFLFVVLVISQSSRPDRMAGMYPMLFAGGASLLEKRLAARWSRAALLAIVVAGGLALLPLGLPLLPPNWTALYVGFLGIDTQIERGEGKTAALPQWLADRFGWPELAERVRDVYASLSPEERARVTVLAPSYGHAGALELFAPELPAVISPHNTYHLWGRDTVERLASGPLISLAYGPETLNALYGDVREVARYTCTYCITWRNDMPIYVAREPKLTPEAVRSFWERARHFE
jgi:hypothetical protein